MGLDVRIKCHVGRVLRSRREAIGLSMRDVTEICGVSPATICRIEKGLLGKYSNVHAYALAINIPLDRTIREGAKGVQLELQGIWEA